MVHREDTICLSLTGYTRYKCLADATSINIASVPSICQALLNTLDSIHQYDVLLKGSRGHYGSYGICCCLVDLGWIHLLSCLTVFRLVPTRLNTDTLDFYRDHLRCG